MDAIKAAKAMMFQHTAARRRLQQRPGWAQRLKEFQHTAARRRLPTIVDYPHFRKCFNTQPPEGGCLLHWLRGRGRFPGVSTHSRPKAAASAATVTGWGKKVSTHSRPKAAARRAVPGFF